MHDRLPLDVLQTIGLLLDACNVTRWSATCKSMNAALRHDDVFWHRWAMLQYGADFWQAAQRRPKSKSKPLQTWHAEVVRLERFQNILLHLEGKRWHPHDIRQLWQVIDGR